MNRVAILQMVSGDAVQANLESLPAYFKLAQEQGSKLIVLPENFAFMGKHEKDKWHIAEEFGQGPIQTTLSRLAREYQLWIIAGTLFLKGDTQRVRASSLVFNNLGECVGRYDKIHLFDVQVSAHEQHRESYTIEPGQQPVLVDTPVGRIGLSVCYDLRFPELYRVLVEQGAEVLVVPSAFTATTGKAHWEVLLRARAIENLCYVLAPNQGGVHSNGRTTYGHSMIVNPWGEIVEQATTGEKLLTATIDLAYLQQLRKQFPCNDHRVI